MAGPISILGLWKQPNLRMSSWNKAVSSQNITHSNHSSLQNWLMSNISPDITVFGTSLSNLYISWAVLDLILAFNSKHSSHRLFGALDYSNLWLDPFLSSFIFLSAEFDQRVYGSNCFKWHAASLSFWWNIPLIISLKLSQIQTSRTLSLANSNDKFSCVSLLNKMGKFKPIQSLQHMLVHICCLFYIVLANTVTENTGCAQ